ncbi:MAG TPA: peptidase domain-containing ABC transporter [Planctomycetota bacterium]|nr:peptidase domain-containing ABC transporter [Planctomycetota bacterium]
MPKLFKAQPGRVEAFLATVPLLADLEPEALRALALATTVHSYEVGETVIREGDAADALYVILKGAIRAVLSKGASEVSLTRLGAGDHLGEVGLAERAPRTATCRVAGDEPAFLLRIAGSAVEPVIAAHPRLRATILKLGDVYRTWNFLKVGTRLADAMTSEQLRAFVDLLELRSFPKGAVIVAAGDADSPLVVVRSGFVRISTDGETGVIGEGRYCGEAAVLRGEPAPVSFVAADDEVLAYVAPRRPLVRFLDDAPAVRRFLAENPCSLVDASVVKPLPRSFNVKDVDPTVYLGLEAVPERPAPTGAPARERPKRLGRVFRFPLVRQHDETDCGAAALAMIARFHGKRIGIGRIRELARASAEGATLAGLAEAARTLGFEASGARVSGEAAARHALPAIASWTGDHFVVLYRIDRRHAWVADPAVGLRRLSRAEFESSFRGELLELEPTERLATVWGARGGARRFVEQLGPFWSEVVEIALASLLVDVFALAGPLATQAVIDRAIPAGDIRLVWLVAFGLAVLAAARIGAEALRAHLLASLTQRLDLRLLVKFVFHVVSLPLAFFRARRPGDVLHRIGENARVRAVLAGSLVFVLLDVSLVALTLVVMVVESPKLTLAALAFVPASALVALAFTRATRARGDRAAAAQVEQEAQLFESVSAIETVKALAVERALRWRWEALFVRYLRAVYDAARLEILVGSLTSALATASSVVLLGYGATLVIRGDLTLGRLVAFQALLANVIAPISDLVQLWDRGQEASLSLERVDSVLDCDPEETGGPASLVDPRALLKGRIRFDRVSFRYAPEAPRALEDLSFEIGAGTTVGILGKSGAGKTTLARLLLKLDLPGEGRVTIDDLDLASISAQGLRRSIGYVPEDVALFQGSVAENVALGADDVDRARVEEVLEIAHAREIVSGLPQGLDTLLGPGGSGLSGGQRQRIALARALYHRPRILLLDEATSALDLETEEKVLANLRAAATAPTTILLSLRVSAVRRADRVLVLERGRLVEDGAPDDLARANGAYRTLASVLPV